MLVALYLLVCAITILVAGIHVSKQLNGWSKAAIFALMGMTLGPVLYAFSYKVLTLAC